MNEAVAIVIGAGLASSFGILTAVIQHFLTKNTEKMKEKRTRLEIAYRTFVSYRFWLQDFWDIWTKYYEEKVDYSADEFLHDYKVHENLGRDIQKEIQLYLKVYYRDFVTQWEKVLEQHRTIFEYLGECEYGKTSTAISGLVFGKDELDDAFTRFTDTFLEKYSKDFE